MRSLPSSQIDALEHHLTGADKSALAAANLTLTKSGSPDPVASRAALTYTVTVVNNGPANATEVTLTDPLPTEATFVSASASQGACIRSGEAGRPAHVQCRG